MVYDSRSPAKGVRIDPVPRDKVQNLTMAQVKAARTFSGMGVLRPIRSGGPIGLGMPSTVHASPVPPESHTIPTRNAPGVPRTPGKKRFSGTCCRGPINTVFQPRIPNPRERDEKVGRLMCNTIKDAHAQMVKGKFPKTSYERMRKVHLAAFPHHTSHVERVEALHRGRKVRKG